MSFHIRFLPENRTWQAQEPTDLFMAAAACDILVEQPCGSKTICGKCRVRVVAGELDAGPADVRVLGADAVGDGWRLGCQLQIDRDATIEVPPVARSVAAKSFGDDALIAAGFAPALVKMKVHVPEASEDRQEAAMERLAAALSDSGASDSHSPLAAHRSDASIARQQQGDVSGDVKRQRGAPARVAAEGLRPSADVIRALGGALGREQEIWVVLEEGRLIAVEPITALADAWGVAIDVGSTTLAAALIDLATGAVSATASRLNPQVRFGGDVISRIHFAQEHPDSAGQLHDVLVSAIDGLIGDCLRAADARSDHVYAASAVGNPTMLHTLLGADVTPLGQAPYVGVWQDAWRGRAAETGVGAIPSEARFYVLPGIRSHVGADTVAAILASGMDRAGGIKLLVDLGTNSEVALGNRDGIVCTSTSAGPAFEGANIHQGMRGAPGAIDQVRVRPTGSIMVRTIAGEDAVGICGSGLIDAAAELVRVGVIDPSGRMRTAAELSGRVPEKLLAAIVELPQGGRAVRLSGENERAVYLTAGDIRQLQLIKGSILAGMKTLMQHRGVSAEQVDEVLIAGAFGNFVRKTSAQAIGLVPAIDPERIRFIGNAAGAGARLALVDADARRRAEHIAASAEYIELGHRADYQDAFVEAMAFPAPVTPAESERA